MRQPSEELRRARRAFEDLPAAQLLGGWVWHEPTNRWTLHCRLTIPAGIDPGVPQSSDWYFLVSPNYPWGDIHVHPAKERGLKGTFPHQQYNGPTKHEYPWTEGYLCTQGPLALLGRAAGAREPLQADERLAWYATQTIDWLKAASKRDLTRPGEPFELPHYPNVTGISLATLEDSSSFSVWSSTQGRSGYAELYQLKSGRGCNHQLASPWTRGVYSEKADLKTYCVQRFFTHTEKEILEYSWGRGTQSLLGPQHFGIWVMANTLPVIAPWQAPATLGELTEILKSQGIELIPAVLQLAHRLRDGARHHLLIGSPIPDKVGGAPTRVHWNSFLLPALSRGGKKAAGFRANEAGYILRDAQDILRPDMVLGWSMGENWSDDQLASRGRWAPVVSTKRYVLIGAGALGSAIGELLVRAGVQDLHILDHELFQAGNSRRHTLGLDSLEKYKATEVAARLNLANPNARVTAGNGFPASAAKDVVAVAAADVIIDCTGNDQVLNDLSTPRDKAALMLSVSMGLRAKRLYCYAQTGVALDRERFAETTQPWLERDIAEYPGELPREAIGCWHPAFPARADDVWAMAAVAAKEIERLVATPPARAQLSVFEQRDERGAFAGLVRVETK